MKKIIVIALIMSFLVSQPLFAAPITISDVASSHWAYGAVRSVVNAGHMSVNNSGEFRPNAPIDKFETSRILASVAGQTPALLSQAYAAHRETIEARASQYTRWNNSSNREIAFLLERGIYTENDLGNFIARSGEVENLRALSRQEAAVYLVRLMGRSDAARSANLAHDFADNTRINEASRPYVYYLRNLGIIAGEPGNNFNPNGIVTRTTLAVLLNRVQQEMGPSNAGASTQNVSSPPQTPPAVSSISGNIEQVHVNANSLQIRQIDNDVRIISISNNANIFVNGQRRNISDLRPGMPIVAIIQSGSIVDLQAQSAAVQPTQSEPANQTPAPPAFIEYRQIIGTVYEVRQGSILVDVRILNPQGFVVTQRETITINNSTTILRSTSPIAASNIVVNDAINVVVRNGVATRIELFERNRSMNVTVVERRTESVLGTNYFIVEDLSGMRHELVVDESTMLTRQGSVGNVRFNDIRIGDTLDLLAEYSLILEAYAYGSRGSAEGTVSEILIARAGSSVVIIDSRGQAQRFHVRAGAFDIHSMRLNSRVSLRLDSLEIEGFTVF